MLSGCGTMDSESTVGKAANYALEKVGLKAPETPELPEKPDIQMPPRKVALKIHAGSNLNAGLTGKPLSLVTRIYKLKQTGAFNSAPYTAFLSPEAEKEALGADLVEVRELSLVPDQKYEVVEKLAPQASYLGIVTLFRSPAPQRWRAAFAVKEAESAGIIVGLHACSLTVGKGAVAEQGKQIDLANSPARCQAD
jgi:type VI secretion system protein VasD